MKVAVMDPGKGTGWAFWSQVPYEVVTHRVTSGPAPTHYDQLHAAVYWCDLFISEDFIISVNTARKSQDGKLSIELMGAARYLCHQHSKQFETQTPSDAKNFGTKEKLQRLGWIPRGFEGDHALSATRHLVLALVRHGLIDASRVLPTA